jgi:hypothetical protein
MTGIYAVSRSMVSSPSTQDEVYDPEEAMYRLAAHTHYFPAEWRQQCHTYDSLDKFLKLFQFKAVIFAQELLSTIFTPLILCFSLPSSADNIVDFFRDYTTSVEGLGEVCSYSRFDLSKYGNNNYTGKNPSSTLQPTAQGKMEKSFLSFQEQHPKWFPQDGDSIHFQEKIQNFAMCQSQIQLGLEPSLNVSQNRAHASMGRSVRFEETTDPSNQDGHQSNGERLIGLSQSMDMSGLQGSEWNSRIGGFSRMGSNSMLQSNIAGSQFYWLEKYMTQKREDTIQEE